MKTMAAPLSFTQPVDGRAHPVASLENRLPLAVAQPRAEDAVEVGRGERLDALPEVAVDGRRHGHAVE